MYQLRDYIPDTLRGRQRIYTDAKQVTRENVLDVLSDAFDVHAINREEMQFLIDYELGEQPLPREKIIRPEVDIEISENAANYVVEFKKGYFWGTPPVLIQHADREIRGEESSASDDIGISALNEMLLNGIDISYQNQILGDFVEKCGIGHVLVQPKSAEEIDDEDSRYALANVYALDSRYAFCVYHNGVEQKKVLGTTFTEDSAGKPHFTCYTDTEMFDIVTIDGKTSVNAYPNLLGMIPVVEFNRAIDRTGCFERHISYMDGLNTLVSDFANDVAQSVQQIWWGDNVDFQEDDNGNIKKPESGDWLLTYSAEGRKATVQALASNLDRASTLNAISFEWNRLLQKCKVPIMQESAGGGSTGTATSMAAGWQSAEVDAMREEGIVNRGFKEMLRLILKAVRLVPSSVLEDDSPLRTVKASDVDFHFNRNRNYDLSIKANTFATLVNAGMHGRHALKLSEITPDTETVWVDSQEIIEAKQRKMFESNDSTADSSSSLSADTVNEDRIMQDGGDQISNSPFLGNLSTE